MKPRSPKPIVVCSNDNPGSILTFLRECANDGLLKFIAACDLEVGWQIKPSE